MEFTDLVKANRSYRKFDENFLVPREDLLQLVEISRFTPSSKNRQPLKYLIVTQPEEVAFVFKHLKWAWFLRQWEGPAPGERPPSYIIMLLDKTLNDRADFDAGICAQTILLGATAKGLGGCMIRTVNRYELGKYFRLDEQFEILLVMAIGKPTQEIIIEHDDLKGNMEYWADEQGRHHVPKRKLDDLLFNRTGMYDQD